MSIISASSFADTMERIFVRSSEVLWSRYFSSCLQRSPCIEPTAAAQLADEAFKLHKERWK